MGAILPRPQENMFENIPAQDDIKDIPEEKKTPPAPLAEQKTPPESKENVSEDAKTLAEDKGGEEERFDKHSRFQELREQVNEYKQKYEELIPIAAEVETMKQQIAQLTGQKKSDLPKLETMEDLTAYLAELPKKVKAELLAEMEAKKTEEVNAQKEADAYIQSEIKRLKDAGGEFEDQELIKFALEYKLNDLEVALKLFKQIGSAKEDGKKQGEEFAKRKAESGIKSSKNSDEPAFKLNRHETLEDVFAEAKRNIIH